MAESDEKCGCGRYGVFACPRPDDDWSFMPCNTHGPQSRVWDHDVHDNRQIVCDFCIAPFAECTCSALRGSRRWWKEHPDGVDHWGKVEKEVA